MFKKILAFALSTLMLAQSVSAASLYDFVNDPSKIPAQVITNNLFDYGNFRTLIDQEAAKEIPTTAEAVASVAGSNAYAPSVSSSTSDFDFKVTLDMTNVKAALANLYSVTINYIDAFGDSDKDALKQQFKDSVVTGDFKVVVNVDNGLTGCETPNVTLNQVDRASADAFEVTGQTWDATNRVVTIDFQVASNITIEDLYTDNTLLNDLYVTYPLTATTTDQNLNVTAQLTQAKTTFSDNGQAYGFIEYLSNADTATVRVTTQSLGQDGTGGGGGSKPEPTPPTPTEAPKAYLVTSEGNIEVPVDKTEDGYTINVDAIDVPEKNNFVLEGLYLDPVFTKKVSGIFEISTDTYIYPKYINVHAPGGFTSDEHILYIVGYPDGEVKPNNNITREEVVAALYRLLTPEFRATIDADTCNFPDVNEGRWSYDAIAAFANAGYVVGDQYGNFNPGMPITRAEFVTIVNHFAETPAVENEVEVKTSHFTDIAGHWAEKFIIASAVDMSWVTGYEDNTFKPNARITRAEAITIINKMLVRYGDVDSELATQWPDLEKSDWYYGAMIEATTAHKYTRKADGWNETWTK